MGRNDVLDFVVPNDPFEDDELAVRLTELPLNQDLTLSLFVFYSPSDEDAHLRPRVEYKITDAWQVTGGANVFAGFEIDTFFCQLENNSNV